MKREEVFNFAAGPSTLPQSVLERAAGELLNYRGTGMSVMEMSHRSAAFREIFDTAKASLRELLNVPESHENLEMVRNCKEKIQAVMENKGRKRIEG